MDTLQEKLHLLDEATLSLVCTETLHGDLLLLYWKKMDLSMSNSVVDAFDAKTILSKTFFVSRDRFTHVHSVKN